MTIIAIKDLKISIKQINFKTNLTSQYDLEQYWVLKYY